MGIIYRSALINDSPEIARLSSQLGYPVETNQVIERLSNILNYEDNYVYVAELNEKLVGWVHAHGRYLIESPICVEIGGLIVDSDHRGQSIGKTLMKNCEEWASVLGFREIRVRSGGTRISAHKFYAQIGYENIKSQQVFNKKF